jgi:hypothetical protein
MSRKRSRTTDTTRHESKRKSVKENTPEPETGYQADIDAYYSGEETPDTVLNEDYVPPINWKPETVKGETVQERYERKQKALESGNETETTVEYGGKRNKKSRKNKKSKNIKRTKNNKKTRKNKRM